MAIRNPPGPARTYPAALEFISALYSERPGQWTGSAVSIVPDAIRDDQEESATLTGEATQRIRQWILDGELEPGGRINEVHLGDQLAISRTPLRAALQTLAGEGLLVYTANRGFTVRAFELLEVIDAYTLRGLAEGLAARLAAERGLPEAEREIMEAALEEGEAALKPRLSAAQRQKQYAVSNEQFHGAIHRASGTGLIGDVVGFCRIPHVSARRVLPLSVSEIEARQAAHHDIFLAILAREGARAECLMREHVTNVKTMMIAALTQRRIEQAGRQRNQGKRRVDH